MSVVPFPADKASESAKVSQAHGETGFWEIMAVVGDILGYLWRALCDRFNKWMRITASIGLTSMSALNTYEFLRVYNDWRAALASAVSFELMYIASAWKVKLDGEWRVRGVVFKWKWLAHDAVIIIVGVICATVYNVLNHSIKGRPENVELWAQQMWLAVVQSILLTLPACLLLISVHANNDDQERIETKSRLERIEEAITIIRGHLKV